MELQPDVIPLQKSVESNTEKEFSNKYSNNVILIPQTRHVIAIKTILRNKKTSRSDFVFYSDKLIRFVIEVGVTHMPYKASTVETPTGGLFEGMEFEKSNYGVSVVRSGEAMEKGLRECFYSVKLGKILIQTDYESEEANVFYGKFPKKIEQRKVLLMYPTMTRGRTILKAMEVLSDHGVTDDNVTLVTLFCTPESLSNIIEKYPNITIVTAEISAQEFSCFGEIYFGTK